MPYAKINPSGCTERHGLVQVRFDMFLSEGDLRYDDPRFYVIDETSKAFIKGYPGKVDELGSPIDLEAYAAWEDKLPRIWLPERCFHHHFIYLDPYSLRDGQITDAIAHHLPNFYKAWIDEWDKSAGGMRHGWDVATRRPRPTRFNKTQPELYVARRAECLAKTDILKMSSFTTQVKDIGETFPSTDIDVGYAASSADNARIADDAYVRTRVSKQNPANDTGTIDSVDVYVNTLDSATTAKVGSFSDGGSNVLTCHDSQSVGSLTASSLNQFTGLDFDIDSGEYIGIAGWNSTGNSDIAAPKLAAGTTYWVVFGECIDPTDSATFSESADTYTISLYGTGETTKSYDYPKLVSIGVGASLRRTATYTRSLSSSLGLVTAIRRPADFSRDMREDASRVVYFDF